MTTEHLESEIHKPATLSDWARKWGGKILAPVVMLLARLGFTPNAITVIGFLLNIGIAILLAAGHFRLGGGLILAAGIFDALDGSLARLTHQQTRFGAFLDSTLDRYSDALVFVGLAWAYVETGGRTEVLLCALSLIGSMMISYTRARAEGLGIECKNGLLTRFERVLIVSIALLIGLAQPMLWLMAVLTNFTAAQRAFHVWRVTASDE
jgi:phosphatidylglycerophosphate synthase